MAGARDIHPDSEELAGFLGGELPPRRARAVVAHLAGGCAECRQRLAPAARALLCPEPTLAAAYEIPVRRALATGAAYAAALEAERAAVEHLLTSIAAGRRASLPVTEQPAARAWAWHERMLGEAEACRGSDPDAALQAAALAVARAQKLDAGAHGADAVADAQARAWAELANARRAMDDLEGAVEAFEAATECFARGSREPRLRAEIFSLVSSLRKDQGRFDEAARLLEVAHDLYRHLDEPHLAARMLVKRAITSIHAAETEAAVDALARGLALIDHERDPALTLAAVHNLVHCLLDLDRCEEAARLLWRCRRLYAAHGNPLDLLRMRGLEARAAAGLGQEERAERIFSDVRAAFTTEGLHYDAAVVSLYLGAVWLDQGRTAEVVKLVNEMLITFHRLGIGREAAASVIMLRRALATGEATAELARAAARDLRSGPSPAPRGPGKGGE